MSLIGIKTVVGPVPAGPVPGQTICIEEVGKRYVFGVYKRIEGRNIIFARKAIQYEFVKGAWVLYPAPSDFTPSNSYMIHKTGDPGYTKAVAFLGEDVKCQIKFMEDGTVRFYDTFKATKCNR